MADRDYKAFIVEGDREPLIIDNRNSSWIISEKGI